MNRIDKRLLKCKTEGNSALIPYIAAGDPYPDITVDVMHALVHSGADIIELGIPFSDPMADGPVIQRALENALAHNVSIHDVFSIVRQFRQKDTETPIVLMGYLNPIEKMGYTGFASACADAGVDGVLTVDLPPEEATDLSSLLGEHEISTIYLMSPTTSNERIAYIAKAASGYIYYVSLKGITGASNLNVESIAEKMLSIQAVTQTPIAVGFGIKNTETAGAVASLADGVVIGSALVQLIHNQFHDAGYVKGQTPSDALVKVSIIEAVQSFMKPMKKVMQKG